MEPTAFTLPVACCAHLWLQRTVLAVSAATVPTVPAAMLRYSASYFVPVPAGYGVNVNTVCTQ